MQPLTHLATRIFDTPLCIQPAKLDVIMSVIGDRLGVEITVSQEAIEAARGKAQAEQKNFAITSDGIAVIPIQGTLMKKTSGLSAMSGSGSYEQIKAQCEEAYTNPAVKGIIFDIDSPGGETHGLFDLADTIFSMRGQKPIYAVANDGAYSAAYAIACAADKIFLSETAGVGSIGVFAMHVDQSGADKQAGLKYTYIKAGDKKTAGNPHEALSESAENDVQTEIDRQYGMFVSLVARNRSMTQKSVAATEAGVYYADKAVKVGLADQVGSFEDAYRAIVEQTSNLNMSVPKSGIAQHDAGLTKSEDLFNMELTAEQLELMIAAAVAKAKEKDGKEDDEACEPGMKGKGAKDGEEEDGKEDGEDEKDDEKKSKKSKKAKAAKDGEDSDDDSDDDSEDDKKGSRADAVRIVNLCTLAGLPTMAAEFLASDYSVAQVEKALLKQRAEKSKEVRVSSGGASTNHLEQFRSAAAEISKKGENAASEYKKYLLTHAAEYVAVKPKQSPDTTNFRG